MHTHTNWLTRIGIIAVGLGACCPAAWGKTWTVGKAGIPCPKADFNTIGAAITAAQSGDTIQICPAVYPEQLVISKPLTLTGISQQGVNRVLIQPADVAPLTGLGSAAVIAVVNTTGVVISNLTIDAANNHVSGCDVALAGIHFLNASGVVDNGAISGAQLKDPSTCPALYPGNGFGVKIESNYPRLVRLPVAVRNSSVREFSRNGILAVGPGATVDISGNSITGAGPAIGAFQFGVFLADGVTGQVTANTITQGSCGSLSMDDCYDLRSEGIVLRAVGYGVLVSDNSIANVQVGIFINGPDPSTAVLNARVMNNLISNVDALSAIHVQGATGNLISGNRISHVGPISAINSEWEEGCGINDVSGANSSHNTITGNLIIDAYCGVAHISTDRVEDNTSRNTLYETLNGDDYPDAFPAATEPGQTAGAGPHVSSSRSRRIVP